MNIVSHVHYSLVNNVPPQGILYPHSHQWMLYPIQYSLVNTVSHTIFTSEYCTPFSRAYQDAHKYVQAHVQNYTINSTTLQLPQYHLYFWIFFSELVLVWACILHCTILRIQCKKPCPSCVRFRQTWSHPRSVLSPLLLFLIDRKMPNGDGTCPLIPLSTSSAETPIKRCHPAFFAVLKHPSSAVIGFYKSR